MAEQNENQSNNESQNIDNQNNKDNQQQSGDKNQNNNQEPKDKQDSGNKANENNTQPKVDQKPKSETPKSETPKSETPKSETPKEIKYELKLKDGSLLDTKAPERIAEFAKKHGLSQEAAAEVLDGQHEALHGFKQAQEAQFNDMKAKWVDDAMNDKEFGGEAFAQNVELAKRALDRFATPEFKKSLESTGLGNYPELIRICYRIGKAMKADSVILSGTQAGSQKTLEEIFYGDSKKE